MNARKRWTSAVLSLALALSLSIPSALAVPAAEPFADFRIDAVQMAAPDRSLHIALYQRDETGAFLHTDDLSEECKVNQVTGDAVFYIQPNTDGVWVTVDYLTSTQNQGLELRDGGGDPVHDSLTAQGGLVQGGGEALARGQIYILSAETLADRFEASEQAWAAEEGWEDYTRTFPLCRVTISRTNPEDSQTYEQLYYLQIFDSLILPDDVLRDDPHCSAIEYCLNQGWFTGLDDGSFGPDLDLNRAQLAQVLWTVGGCQPAEGASFSDVSPEDWFYQAVSWCRQEGLIAGYADGTFLPYAPLTREQLASFLQRYANYAGSSLRTSGDLSQFDDAVAVSPWAYDSMRWAVSNHLLTVSGNALCPGDTVTRAELASALYAYRTSHSSYAMW